MVIEDKLWDSVVYRLNQESPSTHRADNKWMTIMVTTVSLSLSLVFSVCPVRCSNVFYCCLLVTWFSWWLEPTPSSVNRICVQPSFSFFLQYFTLQQQQLCQTRLGNWQRNLLKRGYSNVGRLGLFTCLCRDVLTHRHTCQSCVFRRYWLEALYLLLPTNFICNQPVTQSH